MSVLLEASGLVLHLNQSELPELVPGGLIRVCIVAYIESAGYNGRVPWQSTSPFVAGGTGPALFETKIECDETEQTPGNLTARFESMEFSSFGAEAEQPNDALASILLNQVAVVEVRLVRGRAFDVESDPFLGVLRLPLRTALAETSTLRWESRLPLGQKQEDNGSEPSTSLLVDHGASSYLSLSLSATNALFDAMLGGTILEFSDSAIHAAPSEWFSSQAEAEEPTQLATFDLEISLQLECDVMDNDVVTGKIPSDNPRTTSSSVS